MAELVVSNGEAMRRAEIRSKFLVPLYVSWTSDVPTREAQAALLGVQDALTASGQDRRVINYGSSTWGRGDYSSADWYIRQAQATQKLKRNAGYGPQVVVDRLVELLHDEPWQASPHWDIMITNSDLTGKQVDGSFLNFCFGSTYEALASIQSTRRVIESVPVGSLREAMVRRLLRHEVGHMFGLIKRHQRVEQKLGLHCRNVCTMRQGMSITEWVELTREEETKGIHFCGDCKNELAQSKNKYKPLSAK